jgi:hypothetical protein
MKADELLISAENFSGGIRFPLADHSSTSDLAICTKPLARQTLRVRYFRHYGLPQHSEALFASCTSLFTILRIAGENRFNPHNLTASAANASGLLQIAVSTVLSFPHPPVTSAYGSSVDTALRI